MIETVNECLGLNRVVGSKTFNVSVEEDVIIPDTKPDILNAINTTANICIYKKDILDGKIKLDGNINIYVMYLADSEEGRIRGFNGNIDFTEILEFPGATPNMTLNENIKVKEVECKVLNGRKVNLKAMLEIEATLFENETKEIIKEVTNVEDIQTQAIDLKINSLIRAKLYEGNCKGNTNS